MIQTLICSCQQEGEILTIISEEEGEYLPIVSESEAMDTVKVFFYGFICGIIFVVFIIVFFLKKLVLFFKGK